MTWKDKILTVVNPVAGAIKAGVDKLRKLPTGIKVAGSAVAGGAAVAAARAPSVPSSYTYAPSVGGGRSAYPFAQAGLLLIVGILAYFLLSAYGLGRFAIWAMVFAFIGAVIRLWPKQGFFALFGLIAYISLDVLGLMTGMNFLLTVILTLLLVGFASAPEKFEKLFAGVIMIFGGIGIFLLSAWFQQLLGWAWPHILTTVLLVAYVALVFSVGGQKWGWSMLIINLLVFGMLFTGWFSGVVYRPDGPIGVAIEGQHNSWVSMYNYAVRGGKEFAQIAKQQFYFQTTDYEIGVQEASAKPLGVFLQNIGTTSKTVAVTDTIDVFASLKTASFDEKKLAVALHCYEEGKEKDANLQGVMKPADTVEVAPYELLTVDCIMPASKLGTGVHTIVMEATFDFTTSAFLRGYFMEQETIRSYKRQQQNAEANPLDMFGITDKNPLAIFTGGPLRIGIGFDQQPVPLVSPEESNPDDIVPGPSFGITFDKNWVDGEFADFKSVTISAPPGLLISAISGLETKPGVDCTADLNSCTLKGEVLKQLFRKPITLPQTIRIQTSIKVKDIKGTLLVDSPMSIRSVNVGAEYNYRIKKTASITIRPLEVSK